MTIEIIILWQEEIILKKYRLIPVSKLIAKTVTEERGAIHSKEKYPVCPACNRSIDRAYQRYCDRCGQRLCWRIDVRVVKKGTEYVDNPCPY